MGRGEHDLFSKDFIGQGKLGKILRMSFMDGPLVKFGLNGILGKNDEKLFLVQSIGILRFF